MKNKSVKFLLGPSTSIEYSYDDLNDIFEQTIRKNGVVVDYQKFNETQFIESSSRAKVDFVKSYLVREIKEDDS